MAGFKNLFGKADKNQKLQNEVESMQLRKQSLVSVVKNEINVLSNEINTNYLNAGRKAFENFENNNSIEAGLNEFWENIKLLKENIGEKEKKMQDIISRYDEELDMLQTNLNMNLTQTLPQQNSTTANMNNLETIYCSNCGAIISTEDIFCEKCGTKIL